MQNLMVTQSSELTMSSREIADITGKSHSKVMRDIRVMIDDLKQNPDLDFVCNSVTYISESSGQSYPCYELDRDTTECLLTGYSSVLRMKVIKRWKELEAKQTPRLPQTFAEALQLAADQAKQIEDQEKQLQLAAPKVEFVDRFCVSEGNKTFREVAKILKANEREFRDFLFDKKIMYRLGKKLMAYQTHIDAKRFHVSTGVADNDHAFTSCKFTPKGVEYVAGKWIAREVW